MPATVLSIWSPGFIRAYVITMRPYLLFISGAAGLVGLSFIPEPTVGRIILAFIPLFLSYGFGQALTDCFQTDTDSLSSPYRPLVMGIVSRRQIFTVSLIGLVAVVLVLAYLNPAILVIGVLGVVGLLTYTYLKRTWWGGPPWNAWIVALLPLMGRFVDRSYYPGFLGGSGGFSMGPPALGPLTLAVLAVFFGYANFVVMGYFKDISADRETGYHTFPVVFGWKPAAVYGDVTAALSAMLTARVLLLVGANVWSLIMFVAGLGFHIWAQVAVHRTRDEHGTGGLIANGIRALTLYCLAIASSNRIEWTLPLLVFYAFFELTLRLRPEQGQV